MNLVIDEQWEKQYSTGTAMLCGGRLSDGTNFHVEAIRVKTISGIQVGYDKYAEERLAAMEHIDSGDGQFHTVKLVGYPGKWVLNVLPGRD